MAAYHRVYDSRHLQADWQEPESAPVAVIEYRLPFLCTRHFLGSGRVWSIRPPGATNSTQQGRHTAVMWAVAAITAKLHDRLHSTHHSNILHTHRRASLAVDCDTDRKFGTAPASVFH